MRTIEDRLKDISDIRSMMEQSSKFLSLSGLSGISAGIVGIAAAVIALNFSSAAGKESSGSNGVVLFLIGSVLTLIAALSLAAYFSLRMARKKELPVWSPATKSLLVNLFIPLAVGGLFCLILVYHNIPFLIAPSMLIFYGLALLNASKYTLKEIRYLGMSEICLGLIASIWVQFGIVLWGIGFGILHIVYGTFMYFKYEK
jgi:hypothetical protein